MQEEEQTDGQTPAENADGLDPLKQWNRDHAAEYQAAAEARVDKIDPELLNDVGPLVVLEIRMHTGTDAFGNHLAPEERDILVKTASALRGKLADRYTEGDLIDLNDLCGRAGMNNCYVQEEIARRFERREGD